MARHPVAISAFPVSPNAPILVSALEGTSEGNERKESRVFLHRSEAIHEMTAQADLTDRELIEGIRSCDPKVAQHLLDRFWEPLIRYAEGILGDTADAQDVVQDAFVRLWSHRERWGTAGSVRALLYTVTRNAALDERRRLARQGQVSREYDIPYIGPSPSDDLITGEAQRAAVVAISRLPPKRREVFRLAREEGLTYKEIAAVMGISAQTVANQMSSAMTELKRALEPYLDIAPRHRSGTE